MLSFTRQVFQAILSNGYEVRADRKQRSDGTMVWLVSQANDEEAFYFFTDDTETQVIKTLAWQYCTATQLTTIFGQQALPPHEQAEPHFEFA
ncbi:MAG: hypothetical protein AAGH99_07685 [Planctomycetota bacterium]